MEEVLDKIKVHASKAKDGAVNLRKQLLIRQITLLIRPNLNLP